jgi:hypothetical protein
MSDNEICEIKELLGRTTPGNWAVSGVIVKNGIMSATGDWPDEDDEANHEFLARSKEIITKLLAELDRYKAHNEILNSNVGLLEMAMERYRGCSGPVSAV